MPRLREGGEAMSNFGIGFGAGVVATLVLFVVILRLKGWI